MRRRSDWLDTPRSALCGCVALPFPLFAQIAPWPARECDEWVCGVLVQSPKQGGFNAIS